MPDFIVTAPDGAQFQVSGPPGSTEAEAQKQGQMQWYQDRGPNVAEQIRQSYSDKSAGDIAKEAASNIVPSAKQFASDIVHPIAHPVETYLSLKNLGRGVLQKTGLIEGHDAEIYADDVALYLKHRWGGIPEIKRTMATDPVGFAVTCRCSCLAAVLPCAASAWPARSRALCPRPAGRLIR
jgi:hypothetical protein